MSTISTGCSRTASRRSSSRPLYFLFLPGLLFLIGRRISAGLTVLLVIAAAQLLLVNFKAFQPRFYLFLVPIMGAAVGEMAWRFLRADWPPVRRKAILALFGLMLLTAAVLAPIKAYRTFQVRSTSSLKSCRRSRPKSRTGRP